MAYAVAFGGRVRQARKALGLTQSQLGLRLDIRDQQSVSHYELGKELPTLAGVAALAEALRITSDWLLRGEPAFPDALRPGVGETIQPFRHEPPSGYDQTEWLAVYESLTSDNRRRVLAFVRNLR